MIRALWLKQDGRPETGGAELIDQWQAHPGTRLWLDIQGEPQSTEKALLDRFHCHPMAINDAHKDRHPPKVEEFEHHTLILYRGISSFDGELNYQPQQMAFFLFDHLLITLHPGKADSIERLFGPDGLPYLAKSSGQLALRIMYYSAGYYLDSLLEFENQLSDLEDEILDKPTDTAMKKVIMFKSRLVKMRRLFNYHRGITQELFAYDYRHLLRTHSEHNHAINDVHERFERLYTLTQMYYDISSDLLDGYLSLSTHQLNLTIRVLTVITAIFVPLGFLAGIYGMNFEHMPELEWRYAYFVVLGIMFSVAVGSFALFKWKKWL